MNEEEKKKRMNELHEKMIVGNKKIAHCQELLDSLNHSMWKLKMEFQALDRELSLTDGRYKVVKIIRGSRTPIINEKKPETPMRFTREQVEAIAATLGVDINFQ